MLKDDGITVAFVDVGRAFSMDLAVFQLPVGPLFRLLSLLVDGFCRFEGVSGVAV